jgi:hypothetical protein
MGLMPELSNFFIEDLERIINFIEQYKSIGRKSFCNQCFCINALPEPDFRYFQIPKLCIYLQRHNRKSTQLVVLVLLGANLCQEKDSK